MNIQALRNLLLSVVLIGVTGFISYAEEVSKTEKEEKIDLESASFYYKTAISHRNTHQYDSAHYYFDKALLLAEQEEDYDMLGRIYNGLGTLLRKTYKNSEAIHYYLMSIATTKYSGNQYGKAIAENGIGNIYIGLKEYKKALYYYHESIRYGLESNNKYHLEINYGTIGDAYVKLNVPDSAEYYIRKSLQLANERKSAIAEGICYQLLGELEEKQNNYKKAYAYYKKALELQRTENDKRYLSYALVRLGNLCATLGKYKEAEELLTEGRELSVKLNSLEDIILANNALYQVYLQTGKYEKACHELEKVNAWKDSLFNMESVSAMNDMEFKYQTEKKEQQIGLLTAENKIREQRIMISVIVSVMLVLLIIGGIIDFVRRKKRNALKQQTLNQQLLRMQMNPHFLFNALGSIQNYMYRNETKKAAGYLNNFASLTRSILEHTSEDFISLDDEIKTLRNYLELEQMRTNHSFDYQILYENHLDTEFIELPPMLIQPFVENAVKHGLRNLDYPGLLIIRFHEDDSTLHVIVTDNGHGVKEKPKKASGHRSMSMQIFEKRQKLLSRQLKKNIYFSITNRNESKPGETGTRVEIKIPLMQ
jgi:tetratricopeptide (TPR) repeat protein